MSTLNQEKSKAARARRKKAKWVGPVIIMLTLAALAAAGVSTMLYINRQTAEVVPARKGKAISAVYGTVKVEWAYSKSVKAEVTGYITFAEGLYSGVSSIGNVVKKDQPLARITDEATARQIQQARNDFEAALERQRMGPLNTQLLRNAEDNLKRLQQLEKLGNVPAVQLEQAKNEVTRLKDEVRAEEIEINRMVDNLTLNVKNLMERQSKSEIKSPMDGILTGIGCTDGEKVFENNVVFTIAQNRTYLSGQVNEEDVGSIRPKMKASIRLYSFANQEFKAVLSSIQPGVDPATQRYSVVLSFDPEASPVNPMAGMTGEMNIVLAERDNSILIPASALVVDKVFIVKDNVVVPRDVQVGFRSMERVEILSGIDEGDLVIKADQDQFSPGERVRPIQVDTTKKP